MVRRLIPLAAFVGVPAVLALACNGGDLTLPGSSTPKAITAMKGDGQSAVAGGILPDSLVVRVTDASNAPVTQIRVAFKLLEPSGGGRG